MSWAAFTLVTGRSIPFDIAHAAGNVVFALAIGPALFRLLERYARRIRTRVVVSPAGRQLPRPPQQGLPAPPPPGPARPR